MFKAVKKKGTIFQNEEPRIVGNVFIDVSTEHVASNFRA
jgi:hypothetical protein